MPPAATTAATTPAVPSIAFGADGDVQPDLGRSASLAGLDLQLLRFTAPKDAEDRGDSKVCTARAFLLPGKGSLRIRLTSVPVTKVTHSRRDAHTLSVSVGQGGELQSFLLALDARVLEVAQASTDAWFMSKMNADLVEEYYRGCSAAQLGHGSVGRFVVDGAPELPTAIAAGASVDVLLQLVGLQFRPQYFTCVWKVVRAAAANAQVQPAEEAHPPPKTGPKRQPSFAFSNDGDGEGDASDDDGCTAGPTAEERAELRQGLMTKLMSLESYELDRIDALREMIRALDAASIDDLGVLGDVDTRLSSWDCSGH